MGATITCCKCGGRFDERALEGAWLDRHCPLCRKRIAEGMYDAKARDLIAHSDADVGEGASKAAKLNAAPLDELALSRYYVSEWFRLACASKGSDAYDQGLFGLHVGYDQRGRLRLVPADDDRSPDGGWGRSAEYLVFDALRAEIARKKSPLHGALLVPSLIFPWLPGQKPKQWGARHRAEVDCVLLGPSCAVVVEVKRRNHHVKASRDCRHIRERRDQARNWRSSDVLEQVANGAEAFAERQQLYPPQRVFRLVVFVEPLSFTCAATSFQDGLLVSSLDARGNAPFVEAVRDLAAGLSPIASDRQVADLGRQLFDQFGNTQEPRKGRIVRGHEPDAQSRVRNSGALLDALQRCTQDEKSPLFGARLLRYPLCEVQAGRRGKVPKPKQVRLTGLLLMRSHAVFIDARSWPVHVNTHVPFATVYIGEPQRGAKPVHDSIRHDWDLQQIHYDNRSGSLTLLTYLAKSIDELAIYQQRNRVCTLNAFINPRSFHSDCEDFRSRTFLGYWNRKGGNIVGALQRLAESAPPVLTQQQLDDLADDLSARK